MRLQNSAQQTCQSGVSQSMGQWVHEMLKLSESAQLGNQERVVNNPDTLLKSHAVGYSGFIVYIWLINLVSKLASVNSYAQKLVHIGLLLLCLVYRIALWKS